MANTRSAKKMVRKIARKTAINRNRRTAMRTIVRKVEDAINAGDKAAAQAALALAEPALARAASRNLVHKNLASRKISRLTHRVRKLGS